MDFMSRLLDLIFYRSTLLVGAPFLCVSLRLALTMRQPSSVVAIQQCQVAPPENSVPTTSLPLTFFDVPWLLCCPMQRLFFYELPQSTNYFTQTVLSTFKHSLSLTLQHFFPFAGVLVLPPRPEKPHILYTAGNSVSLTVAESTADFNHLVANSVRHVRDLHPYVAHLGPAQVSSNNTCKAPLMAVQVTVFPNQGICIGITFCHVAADGRAFHHFMKSWASIFKTGGDLVCLEMSPPVHDKAVIKDPNGLEQTYFDQWWTWSSGSNKDTDLLVDLGDKVRGTFVLEQAQIEGLKHWIRGQWMDKGIEPSHISTFVVTCALLWVCLVKSQDNGVSNVSDNNKLCHLGFLADCRNRLEFPIPSTYFGNCLALAFVPLERCDLVGEDGIFEAAKAIGNTVQQLESGVFRGSQTWLSDFIKFSEPGHLLTIAGSPRFGVYETDFGWGRPKKSEVVHIDASGSIALSECRDKDGAIEVGLALSTSHMDNFVAILEQSLKLLDSSRAE